MNGAPPVAASPDGRAAWLVILAGVSAALHVGKLAPALTALRDALDMGLVEAGFLISLVQFAGMAAGLFIGLAADGMGLRRCMLLGLGILGLASLAGAFSRGAEALLWLRALEGLGVLLACLPAPGPVDLFAAEETAAFAALDADLGRAVARAVALPKDVDRPRKFAEGYSWEACTRQFLAAHQVG